LVPVVKICLTLTGVTSSLEATGGRVHAELIELSYRLLRAIQSRDARALAEILADDFQHFDTSGAAVGKRAFTAGVLEAQYEVLSIGFEVIEVALVDSAAGGRRCATGRSPDAGRRSGDLASWVHQPLHPRWPLVGAPARSQR